MAQFFDGDTTATGSWVIMEEAVKRTFFTVQVTSADAASSTIVQGRINSNHDPVDITTITGDGAETCAYFPEIRVDVTTTGQLYADGVGQ